MLTCAVAGIWLAVQFSHHWPLPFRVEHAVLNRQVGKMVRARFGPGECIVTSSQEQLLFSRRFGFLAGSCAPGGFNSPLETCLSLLLFKCPRDQEIPYIIYKRRHNIRDQPNAALRALVLKHFKVAGIVKYKQYSAKIYRMKREQLKSEFRRFQHRRGSSAPINMGIRTKLR